MSINYSLALRLAEVHDKYPAFMRRWQRGMYIDRSDFYSWLGY